MAKFNTLQTESVANNISNLKLDDLLIEHCGEFTLKNGFIRSSFYPTNFNACPNLQISGCNLFNNWGVDIQIEANSSLTTTDGSTIRNCRSTGFSGTGHLRFDPNVVTEFRICRHWWCVLLCDPNSENE